MELNELKEYFTTYIPPFFGECLLEIEEQENRYKVKVLDREKDQLVNNEGEVVEEDYQSTTCSATLYVDKKSHLITFIEHGYNAFTKANKNQVMYLCDLVGKELIIK